MADYKHGAFGELAPSISTAPATTNTGVVYIGTAPVNLVRGYAERGIVNEPVKIADLNDVRAKMGDATDWAAFTLCEAFKAHFNNAAGNIGPIVCINVLDPDVHKKDTETTTSLTFSNGRATINSSTIILDTLTLADKVEGTDFSVDYDYTKGQVIIDSIGAEKITGSVNVTYSEVDTSKISEDDVIGGVTANGEYTGLGCIALVYQSLGIVPTLIAAPGWSHIPKVYEAMIIAGTKINGHWDAVCYADIPIMDKSNAVDTIEKAIAWKNTNAYNNERTKVFWPQGQASTGDIYHLSTIGAWRTMLTDYENEDIPMETPSNKPVPMVKQYFGESSKNRGFDQQQANKLNENGITTIVYFGGWVLWGPHTAAYKFGSVSDARTIFDNSLRMMFYVSNGFQSRWGLTIDAPMTRALADTIKAREQEVVDALATKGAFIGEPVVEFNQTNNPTSELIEGNFVWGFKGTPTPPWKSGVLRVAYTDEGFTTYFGEGGAA